MSFPTQSIDFERGNLQEALILDVSQTGLDLSDILTFETWVKFEDISTAGTQQILFCKRLSTGSQRSYFWIWDKDSATLILTTYTNGSTVGCNVSVSWTPTSGVWYHLAVTKTGTSIKFYVNGSQQGSTQIGSNGSIFNGTAPFSLGGFPNDTQWFDGRMVLARAWNIVRTVSEISATMCSILGVSSGLVGEWTLDNVLTDNSGNSNSLTGVNSPTFSADVPSVCSVAPSVNSGFLSLL